MKRVKIFSLVAIMIIVSIFIYIYQQDGGKQSEALFTKAELKQLENLQGQTIKFGFLSDQKTHQKLLIEEIMNNELSIDIELIPFQNLDELRAASDSGKLDFYAILSAGDSHEIGGYGMSFPLLNEVYIISNRQNPLESINRIGIKKVGIFKDSSLYESYQSIANETVAFDTSEAAFEALLNQEIDVFLTRNSFIVEELVPLKDLQLEFIFQSNIINFDVRTTNKDLKFVLDIFNEMVNSSRGNLFNEHVELIASNRLRGIIKDYIQNQYANVINELEVIDVAHSELNFPYVFFELDGASRGIYIEMLDLFQEVTGIDYRIKNTLGNSNYTELFDKLQNNDIQLILGMGRVHQRDEFVPIVEDVTTELVSIVKFENNDILYKPLSQIKFGIVTSPTAAQRILGPADFQTFSNSTAALESLLQGDIDVLIMRETSLLYFRNVLGHSNLMQANIISSVAQHGILGHFDNEELNELLMDLYRLFNLLYPLDFISIRNKLDINYQSQYLLLRNQQEKFVGIIFIGTVATAIIVIYTINKKNKKLALENERDKLTGLYNRETAEKKFRELVKKYPTQLGAFFFFDLDDLKFCNDKFGHMAGDKLIIEFAKKLHELEDKKAIGCRIAGDEFLFFKVGFINKDEIEQYISSFSQKFNFTIKLNEKYISPLYISGGVSIYNIDATDFNDLKKYADLAMYQAKRKKKKLQREDREAITIQLFETESLKMLPDVIKTVIREKQIYTVYQSVNSLNNEEVYGYEALSRVNNLAFTNIIEIIELADLHSKSHILDLIMMEKAIKGYKGAENLFINMTHKTSFQIKEYIEKLVYLIAQSDLNLEKIVIEVSEKKEWDKEAIQTLKQLKKEHRFRVAVDDFGVGYANSYLLFHLKPDIVKIDRKLIFDLDKDQEKFEYLKILTEFINKQAAIIIYEGIESQEELNVLKNITCQQYGQGWYFEKPRRHNTEQIVTNLNTDLD